jgi:DNA-binding MarR family transcriptional regulator
MAKSESGSKEPIGAKALDQRRMLRLMGYNLARAEAPLMKAFFKHVGALQLRPVEYSLLVLIDANPHANQKQLAHEISLSAPNIAVILDRLAERGLLVRTRSEVDRRVQQLTLTKDGVALMQKAESAAATMEQDALRTLSEAERLMLMELLQKVAHIRPRRA